MRTIDADTLKDIEYINKGNFNTVEGIREWIDNAPTVEQNWRFYFDHGYKQAERDLKRPQGNLISRVALKDRCNEIMQFNPSTDRILDLIDNAPTVSFMISPDYVTELENLNKELIKQLEEAERLQDEFVKMLNERIEKSVCKFCQMNKHCELCEISRVFMIIALTDKETKGGAE